MPGQRAPEKVRREQIVSAAYTVALRRGIDGVTLRAVAAEANVSHGLLVFYFKRKDHLIAALLDRVLATTAMLDSSEDVASYPRAPDRLGALLQQELDRLTRDPGGMRLFFEYWALGVRRATIRRKISAALERYRAVLRAIVEDVLASAPGRSPDVSPDALAALAVSFINGGAMQAMVESDRFDLDAYLAAGRGLVERLAVTAEGAR